MLGRASPYLTPGSQTPSSLWMQILTTLIYIRLWLCQKYYGALNLLCIKHFQFLQIHSLSTLLGTMLIPGRAPLCSQNSLNYLWHEWCWKHDFEIAFHVDMIASRNFCRFVSCTFMLRISRSTTSQRCSIGFRSGDWEGHWRTLNLLSCSWNSLRRLLLCDMVHYHAGSSH